MTVLNDFFMLNQELYQYKYRFTPIVWDVFRPYRATLYNAQQTVRLK